MLASLSQPQSESHVVVVYSPQEPGPQAPPGSAWTGSGDPRPTSPHPKRQRRVWAPDGDDHLIYQWVKLDGKSQEFVAQCFGISQSTVSRIVERYERWQAHAAARDAGRLDPAERLRAQRWLAFERNEKMLLSCLRLAGEMEGCQDMSKTVTSHPQSSPSQQTTVRTEWSVLDRTGMAARFLRLAFRINMEQVKLVEATPAPLPAPLSEEEVAEQEALAAEERAQIAAVRERSQRELEATQVSLMDQLAAAQHEAAEARREAAAARAELEAMLLSGVGDWESGEGSDTGSVSPDSFTPALSQGERETGVMHNVNNLHNDGGQESNASTTAAGTCAAPRPENNFLDRNLNGPSRGDWREPRTPAPAGKRTETAREGPEEN